METMKVCFNLHGGLTGGVDWAVYICKGEISAAS